MTTSTTVSGSRPPRSGGSHPASRRSNLVRRPLALEVARIATRLTKAGHHGGTALPGLAARRVWPDGFAYLAGQLQTTILIVGTNGKTTTAGMIAKGVDHAGGRLIANRSGANLRQGIMTSLVRASDLRGRLRPDGGGPTTGVFEVDEAALEQILPDLGPSVIVATNLFRDQLDRYGEADSIIDRWAIALRSAPSGTILVHCADDPRLAMLAAASHLPTVSFGLDGPPDDRAQAADPGDARADPVACRTCGRQLDYAWRSIGHLGAFACPSGHVRRAAPDVTVRMLSRELPPIPARGPSASMTLTLTAGSETAISCPRLPGLINAYNIAAAAAAGLATGRSLSETARSIEGYTGPFGRLEWMTLDGRRVLMVLVKNTISLAETVSLARGLAVDVVLLGLNDAPADGRDVSWIWDTPVAGLVAGRAVVLAGSRAPDLALRLKLDPDLSATPPTSIQTASSLAPALELAMTLTPRDGVILVAATYTAMMGLRAVALLHGDAPPVPH